MKAQAPFVAVLSLALAMCTFLVTGTPSASPARMEYTGRVVRVIDGDTVQLWVDEWAATPFASIRVRLYGIDTPETSIPPGKCEEEVVKGYAAKEFAQALLKSGDNVRIIYRRPDKYAGRINADIILADGRNFSMVMLNKGHAKVYAYDQGGRKPTWCD